MLFKIGISLTKMFLASLWFYKFFFLSCIGGPDELFLKMFGCTYFLYAFLLRNGKCFYNFDSILNSFGRKKNWLLQYFACTYYVYFHV